MVVDEGYPIVVEAFKDADECSARLAQLQLQAKAVAAINASDRLANGYVLTAARESPLKAATIMDCQTRLCEDQPRARVRIMKLS